MKILPNFKDHETIKKAEHVERLWIDFGEATHIFAGIGETFTNLKMIRILEGRIELIGRSDFENLKELTTLDFYFNPIKFASGDIFSDLISLEFLGMGSCRLEKLPENLFRNLNKLKKLQLYSNKLSHLPRNLFDNNLQLEHLYLDGNNWQTIQVDFTKLPDIKVVGLTGNSCINEL